MIKRAGALNCEEARVSNCRFFYPVFWRKSSVVPNSDNFVLCLSSLRTGVGLLRKRRHTPVSYSSRYLGKTGSFRMSYVNRKDKFNPVAESLYNLKPAGVVVRRMERTKDYEALEPDGPWSHVHNAPRVQREASDSNWIMRKDRMEYRHKKIIEILDDMVHRLPKETFDAFLERCYSTANLALNRANKAITGDECADLGDRWVMRFVRGFRLISRQTGVGWKQEEEALLFKLVREECDMLTKQDIQFTDSRSSVRKTKRAWEREVDNSHPTDYREGIGDPSKFNE